MAKNAPGYRQRRDYPEHAIVTLTDSRTGKRRDYWLGTYGSRQSKERYHRLLAAWEAAQLVLGHSSALITDAVYAERDESKVAEVLKKVG